MRHVRAQDRDELKHDSSGAFEAVTILRESFHSLTDCLPFAVVRYDYDLRILYANEAVAEYFEIPREEIPGKNLRDLGLTPDMVEERRLVIHRVFHTGRPVVTEHSSPHKSGGERWFEMHAYPEFDVSGEKVVSVLVLNQDINERRLAEELLRKNEEHLRRLVENSPDCIKILDLHGRLVDMNEGGLCVLEVDDFETIRGIDWTTLSPEEIRGVARGAVEAARSGQRCRFQGYGPTLKGTLRFWDNIITPLSGSDGLPESLLCISRDITEIKKLEERTEELLRAARDQADRDPLTGLFTHRAFLERLEKLTHDASLTCTPLSVAVLDVDNFKFFNEAFGHPGGDAVLNHIAQTLRESCRSEDVIARFGGDEFAIILPGLRRPEAEALLKERVQEGEFGRGYLPEGHTAPIPLRISVGVATYPEETDSVKQALALADSRLFENKRAEIEEVGRVRDDLKARFPGFPLLDSLVRAVDAKDRYTRRHSEEVMLYAARIAEEIRLSGEERRLLLVAALVHDAGKIGVSDRVLRLPRALLPDEYEEVKRHVPLGAGLTETLLGEPRVTEVVRQHHEAWDGTGYPAGLKGEAISPLARILSVADAFSALTSDRPYRKGLTREEALKVLERGAGKQWDPQSVRAFLRIMPP